MTTTIDNQISRESFLFACEICENDNPSITHRIATHFADEMTNLVSNGAFATDSLDYCVNKNGEAEDLCFRNNQPGYFDQNDKFVPVSFENFTKYNLKLDWMVKSISNVLGINKDFEEILPNLLWRVGFANLDVEVPIFFARKIKDEETFDKVSKALKRRRSDFEGAILTSRSNIPSYFSSKIAGNKIISLRNCLSADRKDFYIDKNVLKSAILKTKKDGFTTGYRSACFNGDLHLQQSSALKPCRKSGNFPLLFA